VGGGQARGGGQGINPIHTEGESALPHRNPRGSGAKADSTAETRRPNGELEDSAQGQSTFQRGGRKSGSPNHQRGGGSAVPKIREDGMGHG